jgi:hypothetical protein
VNFGNQNLTPCRFWKLQTEKQNKVLFLDAISQDWDSCWVLF